MNPKRGRVICATGWLVDVRTHVALLRAVNVGGTWISIAELRKLFESLGARNVASYVQSGNFVFSLPKPDPKFLAKVEARITRDSGHSVAVLIRTRAQLRNIGSSIPFTAKDPKTLHVTFLRDRPTAAAVHALTALVHAPDELEVVGREVFLHLPAGYGRTKLNNAVVERKLGTVATTRNWRTVRALIELLDG
ncbi:MAG TPA: DUF1697 domain-containing protein, partial [Acidimicrobiia bacterium]|nr:DUF1697 domain-containing protein [Acidimicrobiia bacterium]